MGDGLWWLHSEQTVKRPGLAFVTPDKPIRYLGQPLSGLFCLASLGEAHQALLERLCALLIEGRGHELGPRNNQSVEGLVENFIIRRFTLTPCLTVVLWKR